jgi:hypothetical protein
VDFGNGVAVAWSVGRGVGSAGDKLRSSEAVGIVEARLGRRSCGLQERLGGVATSVVAVVVIGGI